MHDFKRFITVANTAISESAKFLQHYHLLEVGQDCEPDVWEFIHSLSDDEAALLYEIFDKEHHAKGKRRPFSNWELDTAADDIHDNKEKKPDASHRTKASMHINAFHRVLSDQIPIVRAWKELGTDTEPDHVRQYLLDAGTKILPSGFLKQASIDFLRHIRDKVRNDQALNTKERYIFLLWKQAAKSSVGSGLSSTANMYHAATDPTKIISPDDMYKHLHKHGHEIVDQEEVELKLIKKIRDDVEKNIAYDEDPNTKPETQKTKIKRAIHTWTHGSGKQKGMQHTIGTDEEDPEPYISVDYHKSKKGRDPAVVAKYFDKHGEFNDHFYDQIMKVSCAAVTSIARGAMKRIGSYQGVFDIDFNDRTSFCGTDRPQNSAFNDQFSRMTGGRTIGDIATDVSLKMLDYTSLEGWEEHEGLRMNTAKVQAAKIIFALQKKMGGKQDFAASNDKFNRQLPSGGTSNDYTSPQALQTYKNQDDDHEDEPQNVPDEPQQPQAAAPAATLNRIASDPAMMQATANAERDPARRALAQSIRDKMRQRK